MTFTIDLCVFLNCRVVSCKVVYQKLIWRSLGEGCLKGMLITCITWISSKQDIFLCRGSLFWGMVDKMGRDSLDNSYPWEPASVCIKNKSFQSMIANASDKTYLAGGYSWMCFSFLSCFFFWCYTGFLMQVVFPGIRCLIWRFLCSCVHRCDWYSDQCISGCHRWCKRTSDF